MTTWPGAGVLTRLQPTAAVAIVAALFGASLALGISIVNAGETGLSGSVLWADTRWVIAAVTVLVVLQSLLIAALLLEWHRHLKIESRKIELRTELMHTSRLAVIGQLSASIAHEINQPLGAILSNADAADLMLAKTEPDLNEIRVILSDIRKDCLRASQVVRQVQTLARKRPLDIREIDLRDVCSDVLHLIIPIARRHGVTIVTNFEAHELLVRADPTLLQQAMLNLLLNSLDELVGVPKARAVIELRATSLQSGEVEILVRDHGNGVPKRYLDQLFDTYFTTKMHGLGLGLPIVRSIVESHGGRIKAENHPEGGAVFSFTIPVAHGAGGTNYRAGNRND